MKKISLWILMIAFMASLARAQDAATQQQLDKLSGQIQDLSETMEAQRKHIDALEKEISELRDKANAPVVNDYASHAELKSLADQIQEIDRKRKEDSDMIAEQIQKLINAAAVTPPPPTHRYSNPPPTAEEPPAPNTPQRGYEYVVKPGDNLGLIIKAYRDQHVKVTLSQIKAANPNINPDVLIPGKKIFIPDPNAK